MQLKALYNIWIWSVIFQSCIFSRPISCDCRFSVFYYLHLRVLFVQWICLSGLGLMSWQLHVLFTVVSLLLIHISVKLFDHLLTAGALLW